MLVRTFVKESGNSHLTTPIDVTFVISFLFPLSSFSFFLHLFFPTPLKRLLDHSAMSGSVGVVCHWPGLLVWRPQAHPSGANLPLTVHTANLHTHRCYFICGSFSVYLSLSFCVLILPMDMFTEKFVLVCFVCSCSFSRYCHFNYVTPMDFSLIVSSSELNIV